MGNRVMAAKRTTGLSAQEQLCIALIGERCSVRGCTKPAYMTDKLTCNSRRHRCRDHSLGIPTIREDILAEMWWVK